MLQGKVGLELAVIGAFGEAYAGLGTQPRYTFVDQVGTIVIDRVPVDAEMPFPPGSYIATPTFSLPFAGAVYFDTGDVDVAARRYTSAEEVIIEAVGPGGDPMLAQVPGGYGPGTAGWALGQLGSGYVTVVQAPVRQGGLLELVTGYDYRYADARAPIWRDEDGTAWPDLSAAGTTATLHIGTWSAAGVVRQAVGPGKAVTVDIMATNPPPPGDRSYHLDAMLAGVHPVPLTSGRARILTYA